MTLQSIRSKVHGVIDKPARKHLIRWHHTQEVRMISQFHVVVWRRSRRATEPVWSLLKHTAKHVLSFPHEGFKDGRFIQHDGIELTQIKQVDALVIRDRDLPA